jgi:hypothetical protein
MGEGKDTKRRRWVKIGQKKSIKEKQVWPM